jgi:hypothetical protein
MLSEDTVQALIALRILVAKRVELFDGRDTTHDKLVAFLIQDTTGMWAKAAAALKAMDAQ